MYIKIYNIFNIFSSFRDWDGSEANFSPCAIVEHKGHMLDDRETSGHYICDIEDKQTGQWFRTNDNQIPVQIDLESVTKKPVVIMFRKQK